jgi:hypothetical protein
VCDDIHEHGQGSFNRHVTDYATCIVCGFVVCCLLDSVLVTDFTSIGLPDGRRGSIVAIAGERQ